jgi:hypothetical protein
VSSSHCRSALSVWPRDPLSSRFVSSRSGAFGSKLGSRATSLFRRDRQGARAFLSKQCDLNWHPPTEKAARRDPISRRRRGSSAGPMVRIRLPPAESLQTFGPCRVDALQMRRRSRSADAPWMCGFSSTDKTTALSCGCGQSATMSRPKRAALHPMRSINLRACRPMVRNTIPSIR